MSQRRRRLNRLLASPSSDAERLTTSAASPPTVRKGNCPVCLDIITERATPSSCGHEFCFRCLENWAAHDTSCPLCKERFEFIKRHRRGGGIRRIRVKQAVQSYQPTAEDEQLFDTTICKICFTSDHEHLLLLCDGCEAAHHTYCLSPPLNSVPEDDWFCEQCQVAADLNMQCHSCSRLGGFDDMVSCKGCQRVWHIDCVKHYKSEEYVCRQCSHIPDIRQRSRSGYLLDDFVVDDDEEEDFTGIWRMPETPPRIFPSPSSRRARRHAPVSSSGTRTQRRSRGGGRVRRRLRRLDPASPASSVASTPDRGVTSVGKRRRALLSPPSFKDSGRAKRVARHRQSGAAHATTNAQSPTVRGTSTAGGRGRLRRMIALDSQESQEDIPGGNAAAFLKFSPSGSASASSSPSARKTFVSPWALHKGVPPATNRRVLVPSTPQRAEAASPQDKSCAGGSKRRTENKHAVYGVSSGGGAKTVRTSHALPTSSVRRRLGVRPRALPRGYVARQQSTVLSRGRHRFRRPRQVHASLSQPSVSDASSSASVSASSSSGRQVSKVSLDHIMKMRLGIESK